MNNDLISREALKEDLRRFFPTEVLEGIEPKTLFAQIMHDIDNAPTVSDRYDEGYAQGTCDCEHAHKRPPGEWTIGYTAKQKKVAVCNLCNCISVQGKTNFCPNCGAKMKGGAEE